MEEKERSIDLQREVEKFKRYYTAIEREGADKLLAWLEDNGFFEAPASAKFHGNYAGGLVEHSNHVFENLLDLKSTKSVVSEKDMETVAIVGLLHDVCKIDAYKIETKNQKNKDGKWEEVQQYTYTNALPLGHGEKSIMLIMQHMKLTDEEMLAIRWHMGGFDQSVKGGSYDMNNAFNQCQLAAMAHIADMIATHIDERDNEKDNY